MEDDISAKLQIPCFTVSHPPRPVTSQTGPIIYDPGTEKGHGERAGLCGVYKTFAEILVRPSVCQSYAPGIKRLFNLLPLP